MAHVRSDDGFAWIARSVVIICGTAFLLVCTRSFFHWYTQFHVVGKPYSVMTCSETKANLPQVYWKSYFHSKLTPGTELRVNDLEFFQRELLQTGYFSKVKLFMVDDALKVNYALYKPLAIVQLAHEPSKGINRCCLYESAKLLADVQESPPEELCDLQLPKMQTQEELQALLELITSMLKSLDKNPRLSLERRQNSSNLSQAPVSLQKAKTWWVKSFDASGWLGLDCPCSEMILKIESPEGRLIWIRIGALRLKDVRWLEDEKPLQLLELARAKQAIWVDARLEELVYFKL